MRILATLDRPTSGAVEIDGIDVLRHPAEIRRRIGFAMQAVGLDDMASGARESDAHGRLHASASSQSAGQRL